MTEPHLNLGNMARDETRPDRDDLDASFESYDPDEPGSPARRRSTVMLAAAGVAAVAVLGVGVFYGPTLWRIFQEKDATLSAPAEVAGLRLDERAGASDTAEYLRTALAAGLPLDETVGAVYGSPGDSSVVIIVGGTATLRSPEQDLDRALQLVAGTDAKIEGIRTMPAGEFGGTLKCGTTPGPETRISMCGWADHGSIAVGMFPHRSIDESADLLRTMRATMQQRQ